MSNPSEQAAKLNAGFWAAELYKIELQRGPFTFRNHEYQIEPMENTCKRVCYMKATRGGFSEIEILKSLHGMIYGKYAEGVLYLFPTTDDVGEFSKSRFGPLIANNRIALGKHVKDTDTTSLKRVGKKALLYLRGARLSETRGSVPESSKLKSIGADKVVFDEVDHMADSAIAKARGRMYDSPWQEEVFIGNPIVPGFGVDKQWSISDQRHWWRKCGSCSKYTCAEKFFMEDPERCVGIRADGTGYIACKNCGREVFIRDGEWQPDLKDNTEFMRGYRWSQLTSMVCDPLEILSQYRNPPEGNLSDVFRLRLGLPHISSENRLLPSQVLECCSNDHPIHYHPGPCCMGVDIGKKKHIVIGARTGKHQYTIFKTAIIENDYDWHELADLAHRFNVSSDVIDSGPSIDSPRLYQKNSKHKTFLCRYTENLQNEVYNDKTGIVSVGRTELMDRTHRLVTTPGSLIIPRACPEMTVFAEQVSNPYKVTEVNPRSGIPTDRYMGENDHFRHALNYFLLAARYTAPVSLSGIKRVRQAYAINELRN